MSEGKHTPGPWDIFTIASPAGVSYRIHAGNKDIAHIPREWSYEPDARLIAAAPDLLEVCRKIVADADVGENAATILARQDVDIRAAIAKATRTTE